MLDVLAQVANPDFWTKALDQVPALAVGFFALVTVVSLFLWALHRMSKDGKDIVNKFLEREDRLAEVIDRNTEAFGSVNVLVYEVRELRRENDAGHEFTRHALRDLANAAGLEKELERLQKVQAHRVKGGPPGTTVIETPPVTLGPGVSEEDGA